MKGTNKSRTGLGLELPLVPLLFWHNEGVPLNDDVCICLVIDGSSKVFSDVEPLWIC